MTATKAKLIAFPTLIERATANMVCVQCGERFRIPPSDVKRGSRFCSRSCWFAFQRAETLRRFWDKVDKSAGPDGCWIWGGKPDKNGYGYSRCNGRRETAHRIAYVLTYGPIPDGLHLDHVKARGCVSRACVNPRHLEPVSLTVNVMRGDSPFARNARKAHCPQGHPYDASNTTVTSRGHRRCKTCVRACSRRRRERSDNRARDRARQQQRYWSTSPERIQERRDYARAYYAALSPERHAAICAQKRARAAAKRTKDFA